MYQKMIELVAPVQDIPYLKECQDLPCQLYSSLVWLKLLPWHGMANLLGVKSGPILPSPADTVCGGPNLTLVLLLAFAAPR